MKSASHNSSASPALLIWVVVVAIAMMLLAGCALLDNSDVLDPHDISGGLVMEFPEQPFVRSDFPDDAIDVYEVALDKDSLILSVRHSGGCKVHEYRLIASNYWLESNPVQLDAVLAHRDPDDPCDAIVSERLAFGLSALRASYFESYGPNGDAIINVHDGTGDPHSIRYEFSGAVTLQKALK